MHPTSSEETRARADLGLDRVRPTLVIWSDWKGELYAFCGRECQRHYEAWLSDPDYPHEQATSTDASFGCFWCGGDLTQGTIWLDRESLADLKLALRR
ncbi:MAG: hypothetical protein E3J29_05525 [Dehalococcoidia bacterium]|nr:MAG: hypothetical protein E3J29_05525 [Dehalococcoidia bacterium]